MSEKNYNPRPIFEVIASSLVVAIEKKDWNKVKELYQQIKKLSEQ
jgi:hypothetical protein